MMTPVTELEKLVAFVYSLTKSHPFVSGAKASETGSLPTWKLAYSLVTNDSSVAEEHLLQAKRAIHWVITHLRPNTDFEVSLSEALASCIRAPDDILLLGKEAPRLACIPMVFEKSLGHHIDLSSVTKTKDFIEGEIKSRQTVTGVYVGHVDSPPAYGSDGYRKVFFCTDDGYLVCIYAKPPYVTEYSGRFNVTGNIQKRVFDSEAFYTVLTRSTVTPA